jgi:hypothetical protein
MDLSLVEAAYDSQVSATANHFQQVVPNTPLLQVTGSDAILPRTNTRLSGTPPYAVVTAGTPFDEVPASLRHDLTIRLEDQFGGTQFSVTRTLAELAGKKLSISYDPASPADQAALEALFASATSLSEVPSTFSSSINFRANLKIDGVSVATGSSAGFGTAHVLDLDFGGPLGARSIPGNLVAGAYYAIGLDLEQISPTLRAQLNADAQAVQAADANPGLQTSLTQDETIGAMLQSGILNWFSERDLRDQRLAKGARVISQRLPSSGLYFNSFAVDTLFGQPVSATAAGATLDIANDYGYVVAKNGSQSESVAIALMQGQTGSEMEASIQEITFSTATDPVVGTSTMRILQQANDQGIPIYRVTNANSATILPLLSYPSSDMALVTSALAQGREVVIPETQVLFAGNLVTGLITEDPATGSAAYLISGGLGVHAGGLGEFTSGTTFAVLVALFFALVAGLALFGVISAAVALFASIMAIVIGIVDFFINWADIVDNQPDRGLTIGEAAAGIGILALFSMGLVLGIFGLFGAGPGILLGLAIAVVSIYVGAFLKSIIVGLLDQMFPGGDEVLYAGRPVPPPRAGALSLDPLDPSAGFGRTRILTG